VVFVGLRWEMEDLRAWRWELGVCLREMKGEGKWMLVNASSFIMPC